MKRSLSMKSVIPVVVVGIAFVGTLVPASDAAAQGCFQHIDNINYRPTNCSAQPGIDRVFRLQTITWKGHKYLFVDEGNELAVLNIDNPLNPSNVTSSSFNIQNVGDSDYDLLNFSVCDDCRFGIASFKAATVLFDLGTGSTPNFVNETRNYTANIVQGGFTFSYGSQQYLVAASLGTSPCPNNRSGVYQFNGVDEAANPQIQCLENGSNGPELVNGIFVGSANPPVIYMSEKFDLFRIYQVQASPFFNLDYAGNGGIFKANMARGYGVSVDEDAGLLAVADGGILYMYDIGYQSGSPAAPRLMSTKTLSLTNANAVGLRYPVVHVSQQYTPLSPLTFDVSNPTNPVPLDQQFWDPSHPWNSLGSCIWNQHTVFSDDGGAMYLSRYSSLQIVDPSNCSGPVAPMANLTLSPQPAFPGDLLRLTNASVAGDRFATWITDGPSPHGSTILAGTTSFSTGTSLTYTLPRNMADGLAFYAHAAVETNEHLYDPGGSTPDQIETRQIFVDRTPQAAITITPPAAVTGDSVALTGTAEGHPADPGGVEDPFEWTVTPPPGTGEPVIYTGSQVDDVALDWSGEWTFDLVVQYEHDTPLQPGVPYSDVVQEKRTISSVAAAFGISPTSPLNNQTITLTSTSAAQTGATLDFDWAVLTDGTLIDELAFCDGPGDINDQCVIPAETLNPGIYDFRLILTNTAPDPDDVSEALIENFVVAIGNTPVDFTWAPTNPQIGAFVGFQITGVAAGDIEQVAWTFGGTGCDGTTTYNCVEPHFPSCDQAAFAYASGGTKTARVTVTTTGGVQQPQVSHVLTVQNTGSCSGPCTYSISPSSRNFASAGGAGTISVSTQSGCAWNASETASWISITSGASGSGSGMVMYQVEANPGSPRQANISVAGKTHTVNQTAVDPCGQGSVPDDGSAENGYGWGTGDIFVQRFTPDNYPFVFTDVCTAFTQAGGDTTLAFDVVVFDDDGPGGGPGTLLGRVPTMVDNVSAWLDHTFSSVDIEDAGIAVTGGSVFIGADWDDGTEIGFFVAADESIATTQQTGYFSADGSTWQSIAAAFPGYRSLMVRTDGLSPSDGEWEQVVGSVFGGGNGFGDPANVRVSAMAAFDGALFVGTGNQFGGEVNLTIDGEVWFLGSNPGFNEPTNVAVVNLIEFNRSLYATTLNLVFGTQVWRATGPFAWEFVTGVGFGDWSNISSPSGAVFGGSLFLGTEHADGCEIWRTPDGVAWAQVHTNGFGNPQNDVADSMAVFRGELYVGTRNADGAELWKSPDGFVWYPVVTGGFGSWTNMAITDLAVFQNALYAGVSSGDTGAQVWRSFTGTSWVQVVGDGFGDSGRTNFDGFTLGNLGLVAAASGPNRRGTVFQSPDGLAWGAISSPGFTNLDNESVDALQYWGDRIFAGTVNSNSGCEVWRGDRHPVFEDGFESGDADAWGAVVP